MLTFTQTNNVERVSLPAKDFNFKKKSQSLILSIVKKYLGRKTKRLILISTLVSCAIDVTNPSKQMLAKINELFKVSDIDEALIFPMLFGCKFWNEKLPEGIYLEHLKNPIVTICELKDKNLNPAELRITANTILSSCPSWLIYDSKRIMRNDITVLLNLLPKLEAIK